MVKEEFELYENNVNKKDVFYDKNISKEIYEKRKKFQTTSEDILRELQTKREEIKLNLKCKRFDKVLKILNNVCFKHMMPRSVLDETKLTPYNTSTMDKYSLNGYLNVSEINLTNKKYFATQIPYLNNLEQFVRLIQNSKTKTIISLVANKEHLSSFVCTLSEPVFFNNEIFYFKENYLINNELIKVLRFNNWKDHTILSVKKLDFFYSSCGGIEHYPIIVHCRAGVGRTGFFIIYDYLRKCNKIQIEEFIDLLIKLRSFRSGLVWTSEQLSYLVNLYVCE